MATAQSALTVTLIAGEALSAWRAVTLNTAGNAGTAVYVGTNGDSAIGVTTEDAASGAPVSVQILGIAKVRTSAAVTAGQFLSAQTDGEVAGADTVGANAQAIGMAIDGASAAATIISCLLVPQAAD